MATLIKTLGEPKVQASHNGSLLFDVPNSDHTALHPLSKEP